MTRPMRNGQSRSPFGMWLNQCPELDSKKNGLNVADIDWCFHQFATRPSGREVQNIMFVEEKQFGAQVTSHQRDTLATIHRWFGVSSDSPLTKKVWSDFAKSFVTVRFWGVHVLCFEESGPLDSAWIQWDRTRIGLPRLIEILSFKRSPITLRKRDERLHHGGQKQIPLPFLARVPANAGGQ